jgi:hypothetical protein
MISCDWKTTTAVCEAGPVGPRSPGAERLPPEASVEGHFGKEKAPGANRPLMIGDDPLFGAFLFVEDGPPGPYIQDKSKLSRP